MHRSSSIELILKRVAAFACLAILFMCRAIADSGSNSVSTNLAVTQAAGFKQPKTLAELLAVPPEQLEQVDIARIDLLCAERLPGAEKLDVEKCLETLDAWARYVKSETERNYHRFKEHPEKFKNSLGRYRMAVMAAVLCQDLRVQYNPKREKELFEHNSFSQNEPYGEAERSFFSDSSDLFLHGLLSDKRYGTCASMPFLYVAIGRRLGYPVSIAETHMHAYVYYDEGNGKHFNIEATENRGFITPSDAEYRNPPWGAPSSSEYYENRGLLRPLSNKGTTGHILAERAAVFRSAGQHDEEAKTWATAARYFPDTPTWKEIAENMQQCAKQDEYLKWRDNIWKKVSACPVPYGPGFAYFRDKRIQLHLFMDESLDRKAVEKAVDEYSKELVEYSKAAMKPIDSGAQVTLNLTNAPVQPPLYFFYRPADGGNPVKVPADFMPPFPHGNLPMGLQVQIVNAKPQDPDTLLEMVWGYYEHMQAMERAKQQAESDRIASGNPVLISEESIPPEFRQSIPPQLAMRISGLHNAKDIVYEMWNYKLEQQANQGLGIMPDPVSAALRQAGVPDAVARMAGLPVSGSQGTSYRSAGMAGVPGRNPYQGIPELQELAKAGAIPNQFGGQGLTPGGRDEHIKQINEQMIGLAEQQLRPTETMKPGFALPYQVVPASAATGNPAVANPLPFGAMDSPLSGLTLFPDSP